MDKANNARMIYFSVLTGFSAVGAAISSALGGWDKFIQTLVIFMAIDYILGIIIALVWKKSQKSADGSFESNASLKGLLRKGAMLLLVFISVQLDLVLGDGQYIRTAVILFFIANEGFSIIENLGIMGLPMPDVIKNAFAAIKKKSEPQDTKTE